LPGLSVSCRLLVKKIPNVIYIPVEALNTDGIQEYVFLKSKKGFKKIVVETGVSNTDHVIITKGLNAGDAVALTDPFALKKSKETQKEKK